MLAIETAVENTGPDLKTLVDDYERGLIVAALGSCSGQQNRAAAMLNVLPTTLHEKMKRLGLHRSLGCAASPGATAVLLDPTRQDFRWRGRLAPGATLEIRGTMGRVRAIAAADTDEVDVLAIRSAGGPAGQVTVNVHEQAGGVVFSVEHSKAPGFGCGPGGRERAASVLGRLRVDFELRVPLDVQLAVRLYSGDIEVLGTGRVDAHTLNGSVRIAAA